MSENFGVSPGFEPSPTRRGGSSYTDLIEDCAAQLMDELFQDLDCDSEPSKRQSLPSTPSPLTFSSAASQLALAVKTDELQDNLFVPYVEMDAILEPFYETDPVPTSSTKNDSQPHRSSLLLGLAWGSFLGSLGLLVFTQFNASLRPPAAVQAAVPVLAAAQPQDIAFAAELIESLQLAENSLSPTPLAPPIATTPLPAFAPASQATGVTPVALPPTTPPPLKAASIGRKTPAVPAVKLHPSRTVALATLSNRLPVLSSGNPTQAAPAVLTPPNLPPSLAPQPLPMGRQAKAGVTVQGILDLGDKSAMLISRNGSTQNVRPGEVLDATGWVFVRVENGQAILQRGNETRSVSGGEQF
ncbi:hypothetical protein [Altericista sp. CCNU0014]|uniref:hypothetical protein n=1 Tax=Altericista sp. CCNU0014 TaxID=3082949 RepID=UPI0038510E5B